MRAESEAKGMSPLKATNTLHDLISFAQHHDPSTIGKMVELVDAKADLNAESQVTLCVLRGYVMLIRLL